MMRLAVNINIQHKVPLRRGKALRSISEVEQADDLMSVDLARKFIFSFEFKSKHPSHSVPKQRARMFSPQGETYTAPFQHSDLYENRRTHHIKSQLLNAL